MDKLQLNDASFTFEPETSAALGFGFRCGFLGLLHMEIIQERLEREFNIELITTAPGVRYRVHDDRRRQSLRSTTRTKCPTPRTSIRSRNRSSTRRSSRTDEFVGAILSSGKDRRGDIRRSSSTSAPTASCSSYEMPLNEIILDFYDQLKSISRGYASLDYQFVGYRESDLVKTGHPGQRRAGRRSLAHRAHETSLRARQVCSSKS